MQGCTGVTLQCSDLQGGENRVRECSTKLSDTKQPILRQSTKRSSAGLYPMYVGLWTITRTYSCTVRGWPVKQKKMAKQHTRSSKRRQHHFPAISPRHC